VVTSGPRIGDAEAAAVAAVAGPQFSVVSGGVLCLVGLLAVVRLFPQLLTYEHGQSEPHVRGPRGDLGEQPAGLDSTN
jgi:hypothetical protein